VFLRKKHKLDKAEIMREKKEWQEEKELLEISQKVNQEKRKLKNPLSQLTTTKLIILFLFINCTIIEIFTGWVTVKCISVAIATGMMLDLTPLNTLIGTVVAEVMGFCIYALKSAKENSKSGIVYETAMRQLDAGVNEPEEQEEEETIIDENAMG